MRRFTWVAIIAAGLLFGTSCSKTQDTAPETRLFGNPPEIHNVSLLQGGGVGTINCDITDAVKGFLCKNSIPIDDVVVPQILLNINYSEAQFSVQTTDPDTPAGGQNDILLVSASFLSSSTGNPFEVSLVLLDDGGQREFNFNQVTLDIEEECRPDSASICGPAGYTCVPAAATSAYTLTSNDSVANDNTWTRGFAMVTGEVILTAPAGISAGSRRTLVNDCLASGRPFSNGATVFSGGRRQVPAITDTPVGTPVPFTIEVTDRAGNLTTWPVKPTVTFDATTFSCTGDDCACCFLLSSNPDECRGKPGLVGPNTFPTGLCNSI